PVFRIPRLAPQRGRHIVADSGGLELIGFGFLGVLISFTRYGDGYAGLFPFGCLLVHGRDAQHRLRYRPFWGRFRGIFQEVVSWVLDRKRRADGDAQVSWIKASQVGTLTVCSAGGT